MPKIETHVNQAMDLVPVFDVHTHLYDPSFGLTLWGIDELLTYHYLVAETLRVVAFSPEKFFAMPKLAQADFVWDALFVRNTPLSEAANGVLTVLAAFGLDPNARDLAEARAYFSSQDPREHFDKVLNLAGIKEFVMTNDPFDPKEAPLWQVRMARDPRVHAALRIDPLLGGISIGAAGAADSVPAGTTDARRFLDTWIEKMNPLYLAASLPPTFSYPDDSRRGQMLSEAVLPACRHHGIPFAMMIGVNKRVNPRLGDAGDSLGTADLGALERLANDHPDNRFLVTTLARENAQALCVAARKFANILPFGCWWFMNNPSLIEEVTLLRLEMLGTSFIPQHSDARVLEQVVYKWRHSKRDIARALTTRYEALERAGREVADAEVRRDVRLLLHDNAARFVGAVR